MADQATFEALRPFEVNFSDEALADLHDRLSKARLPEKETVDDFSQGVPLKPSSRSWHTGVTSMTGARLRPG